jgi:hypothetical protein
MIDYRAENTPSQTGDNPFKIKAMTEKDVDENTDA